MTGRSIRLGVTVEPAPRADLAEIEARLLARIQQEHEAVRELIVRGCLHARTVSSAQPRDCAAMVVVLGIRPEHPIEMPPDAQSRRRRARALAPRSGPRVGPDILLRPQTLTPHSAEPADQPNEVGGSSLTPSVETSSSSRSFSEFHSTTPLSRNLNGGPPRAS